MPKPDLIRKVNVKELRKALSQPFRIATGQHDILENVIIELQCDNGISGFGEAAVATHITGETIKETIRNLRSLDTWLIGQSPQKYLDISKELHRRFPKNKSAIAAVETAILDSYTKFKKIPLWRFFGRKVKPLVTDVTIVIADLEETKESAKRFYKQGLRIFKIKVGRDFDLDVKRVLAVHNITKKSPFILDGNQGFTVKQTLDFLKVLGKAGLRPILVEQPINKNDWDGLKCLTESTKIPICADESVSSLKDARLAIQKKITRAINIKFMKTGIIESQAIALLAKKNGIKLMIGGMMESSLAMTAAAHFAGGLGCFDYVDLDTPFFIKDGLKNNPHLSPRGIYNLSKVKEGIGIVP